MIKYLKDDFYYNDLYDLGTIEECLWWENSFLNSDLNKDVKNKKMTPQQQGALKRHMADFMLYFIKGQRYKRKSETIREWISRDRERDEKLENAPIPSVLCETCHKPMICDHKHLDWNIDKPDRVLFFLSCKPCKTIKFIYDNGEERISKPLPCPKCGGELELIEEKRNERVFAWISKCTSCDFTETKIEDFTKNEKERKQKEKSDQETLQKYRARFCLSDKEGQEFITFTINMEEIQKIMEKEKEKEKHKDLYDKVAKIKRLTIVELEKLLSESLEKEGYIKLELSTPEFGQYVIIGFTIRDSQEGRDEYDSRNHLKRLINKTLLETNWKLMATDGITYRLGFLYGRLKAYESEEDLLKLVKKTQEKSQVKK